MQKRFVSICFPNLTTDWHQRKQPHLRGAPFVLKAAIQNRIVVIASNREAQAKGIQPGMSLADARAMLPQLLVLDDKPDLAAQLLQQIAQWFIRFTPTAAPDAPDGIVLDATGCAHLWGGEGAYVADITRRFRRFGYNVNVAMADTIGAAWALARYGNCPAVIEASRHCDVIKSLPPAALRLPEETVSRLHKLGLKKIQDVIAIPRSALRRRFGTEMLKRLAQAMGDEEEHFTPISPLQPFQDRLPCIEPIVTLTGIEIALQRLLEALCSRLQREGKGLRKAYFRGYRTDGSASGVEISTSRATQNKAHLFYLFAIKLSTIEPASGIELFVLEATTVEDYRPAQERLWTDTSRAGGQEVAELLDRVAAKIGNDAIRKYLPAEHWWPERSFKTAASLDEQPTSQWRTDRLRPLVLLSLPELIRVTAPVPDYPPMNFRYKSKLHTIRRADGPERIEQEWWIGEGQHRDYYAVEDEEGGRYWLFRSGHYTAERTEEWFIHGFFA